MTERYSRQERIIGPSGQYLLQTSKVLVVGCGGLGSPVIQYLAAAGVGRLTLCDFDFVEVSNLNRQTIFRTEDVGRLKAEKAAAFVRALNPDVTVETITGHLGRDVLLEMFPQYDLVLDCVDSLSTKFMLSDLSVQTNVPLLHAAVAGTAGQMMFVPGRGGSCLRCVFEREPDQATLRAGSRSGVIGAVCGIVGSFQASFAIQLLSGSEIPSRRFFQVDAERGTSKSVEVDPRPGCVCSKA